MNQPLISIVICTYNRANYLPLTIESVFAQSYPAVEIIIVDDGSTDKTPGLLKQYGGRVRYFRQNNQGIAVARNTGLRLAKGEFIAFHDDDDLMAIDRVNCLFKAINQYPHAVLALGDKEIIDQDGNPTGSRVSPILSPVLMARHLVDEGYGAVLRGDVNPVPQIALFRRKDAMRVKGFDTQFTHGCEDTDFFASIAKLGSIIYVPTVVCYCRKGHASLTQDRMAMHASRCIYFKKHLSIIDQKQRELRQNLRRRLKGSLEGVTLKLLFEGKRKHCLNLVLEYRTALGVRHFLMYLISIVLKFPIRYLSYYHKN
jgi:glycosyltransferase involved in cell wall biosynthesis